MNITKKFKFSEKRPLLIAEISANHAGNKKKFFRLINSAFESGADMVKIQTYEPEDITVNEKKDYLKIKEGLWKNRYLWDLYKEAHTPFSWHKEAFKIAKKKKKLIFSSPFSIRAVDFLEKLNTPIYKISSFEITDFKLINYIASKMKPIIISTGMSSLNEIKRAIKEINKFHNKVIIMHCVSNYPTKLKDSCLGNILSLKKIFKKNLIGLSDHTQDIYSSITSLPLGVVAIEKHFRLDDNQKSADYDFSLTPKIFKNLKEKIDELTFSLAKKSNNNLNSYNIKFRRSIFASKEILKNEVINSQNITTLRPAVGIPAENYFNILGKKSKKKIKKNSPIFKHDLK
ncbi:pseudaminic acid synthase [Candidatus Pelagibacter sp.]|nr:pseudaminic acid synthase [Candidatus Pelagibacter sp.]|tara:strand:+ start:244 stop:1275 length:1032 start_codon:yes stop_codon:yes gene_type:complete